MKVFTAEQMRAFDKAATEEYGIPSIVLMENAALRVVEFLEMKFSPLRPKKITILCGKGNNGGDGFAIARHLQSSRAGIVVLTTAPPSFDKSPISAAEINLAVLHQTELQVGSDVSWADEYWIPNMRPGDLVIDALFGTGFKGEVDAAILKALHWLKRAQRHHGAIIVSVDIPSAVNADTGEAAPEAVQADYTITLASPKRGMFLRDGLTKCGETWVGSIGTPPSWIEEWETGCECITHDIVPELLRRRPLDAHKGDAGRVVVCGGSYGMSGAPTLAAKAVLKSGAGLCIACVPDRVLPMFAAAFNEATSHPLACDDEGRLVEEAADAMPQYWEGAHAVALGPGLSRSEGALNFARRVVRECPHPLIIDADALYALRAIEQDVKQRESPMILTPHPGEMGELMDIDTKDVQDDRIGVAVACAKRYNAIVVLKGARSIVAFPSNNSDAYVNLTGNSGMATGGSGDVLTGTIAGLLAQSKEPIQATLLGVYLHGLAGDLEYSEKGNGLIAGDIAEALPRAMLKIQEQPEVSPNGRLRRLQ